jgi:hypothetical protein
VVVPFGEQHRRTLVIPDPCGVAGARVRKVRGEQHVQVEVGQRALERYEAYALQDDVSPRVGQDLLLDPIASVPRRVVNSIRRNAGRDL